MNVELKTFMVRLATDLELMNRFVASPQRTVQQELLPVADREVLFSGDQHRIILAISPPPPPPPAPAQQQPPPAWTAWPSIAWYWPYWFGR